VEQCYVQQGFILSNPTLLDAIKPSLPQEFYIANFDTKDLFSKTTAQVRQTIDHSAQGHSCSVVSNTEASYQVNMGDCSQQLTSICINPVTDFATSQYSTNLVKQFKQDIPPILDLIIESIQYIGTELIIAKPWVNSIGTKLSALGRMTAQFEKNITDHAPSMAILLKIMLINQSVQQILHMNWISQSKVFTRTQEQIIQQDINDFRARLQTITENTHSQQTQQESLLEQQREQSQSILQQLEEATRQLSSTQSKDTESNQEVSQDYEDSGSGSGYEDSGDHSSSDYNESGWSVYNPDPVELMYDDLKALKANMDLCVAEGTTCCLLNQTNPSVALWPTTYELTYTDVVVYSIYNFYAAVTWGIIMFSILLISTYYMRRQSHYICQLQLEVKTLRKCQCPNAAAGPSSSSRAPLLNKRKIISALNYAASSTT
jgi:hypothetical protein